MMNAFRAIRLSRQLSALNSANAVDTLTAYALFQSMLT